MEEASVNAGGADVARRQRRRAARVRVIRYALVALFGLGIIWVPTVFYLATTQDVYRSHWSVIIPGSGVGSSLNIDEIGQASTSVASPFTSSSVDPKVNYKAIVSSAKVRGAAADLVGMTLQEYGQPKIKLVDQTSIMQLMFEHTDAEVAQSMSLALYAALESELNRLREEERYKIQNSQLEQLAEYHANVSEAQANLLEYQTSSRISSTTQYSALLASIDRLEQRRSELRLRVASNDGRQQSLAGASGVPISRSSEIVQLHGDLQLREHQEERTALVTELTATQATLGPNNPKVRSLRTRIESLTVAIHDRSEQLLGFRDVAFTERSLAVRAQEGEDVFLAQASLGAELVADTAELQELEEQLQSLTQELPEHSRSVARLDELTRAYQVAETVYLSTLAKQDLGRSDIFASYPMIQLLVPPTLPDKPEKLHRVFAVAGALIGSFFVFLSILILWKRNALLQRLSRSA